MTRLIISTAFISAVLLLANVAASAQAKLTLVPLKGSRVKLVLGKAKATVDLDSELAGTNGTMPGEPAHRFKVLFTTAKDGFFYLVAEVQSHSPISSPMAPCGGDMPKSILWIKADKTLKERVLDSQIYSSCSYNFYDSKLKVTKTGLRADYGSRTKNVMKYDNAEPEKGLVVTEMVERPDGQNRER